jgi:potassium/hydrogen antiporter
LWAGNHGIVGSASIKRFQDGLTWLAQIIMFLTLGLFATPSQFGEVAIAAVALALILMLIARPLAVWLCLLPFRFNPYETGFLAWVGLRGAVSILLALVPLLHGLPNGMALFNSVFIIVLVSLLVQGWTIAPLARRLGLIVPQRSGPVEKVELELPGTNTHELLIYHVIAGSPVERGAELPRWARPSLVIRNGVSMPYREAGTLIEDDHVYLFVAPNYPRLLDRLFASRATLKLDDAEFFGEFTIDPNNSLGELAAAYSIQVEPNDIETKIGNFMMSRLGGTAVEADRMSLGAIELIVREIDEAGAILSVGLVLAPQQDEPSLPVFANARALKVRLKEWQSKRSSKPV